MSRNAERPAAQAAADTNEMRGNVDAARAELADDIACLIVRRHLRQVENKAVRSTPARQDQGGDAHPEGDGRSDG